MLTGLPLPPRKPMTRSSVEQRRIELLQSVAPSVVLCDAAPQTRNLYGGSDAWLAIEGAQGADAIDDVVGDKRVLAVLTQTPEAVHSAIARRWGL